ncbi:CPBP family intramembrane metalloprotease [Myxococcus stipitatus]|uniref:CPBP family intramembrane glutamic endopeptidase n=1 Tax=Myxococcus stipitatus TaxID=83455 RepID=UPI001F394781|nr:CPBP family intramembrane glutamic endopeptidase [Myxococcus stipitatus]MCE9668377.1 CPBP family intramembrane metalloprotease [Myxococcus stipitatus]
MRFVFRDASGAWRNGWKILGFAGLMTVGALGVILAWVMTPEEVRRVLPEPYWALGVTLLVSWVCVRLERQPLTSLGLRLDSTWLREVALGTVGGVMLIGLVALGVWLAGGFSLVRTWDDGAGVILRSAWLMLGVALFEELAFRGYVFQRLTRGVGSRWAQGLMAVVFCLAHPFGGEMATSMKVVAMLNTFLAGLMLGLCYVRTRSLALPVGVHLGWNWWMNCLGFGVSGNALTGVWTPEFSGKPEWLSGGRYGLEASVVCTAVLVLTVVGLMSWKGTEPRDVTAHA